MADSSESQHNIESVGTSSGGTSASETQGLRGRLFRLRRAWIAVKALLENPDDTEQVFRVVTAMRGKSLELGFDRFRSSPTGDHILREGIDLLHTLRNREILSSHGPDSLAAVYLKFVQSEQLSADGLVDASHEATESIQNPHLLRYTNRIRDMHDLWHAMTQYGREPLGEACLLAFTYAQMRNPGAAFIVIVGARRLAQGYGKGTIRALWRAYRDGKRASWLPAQPFEEMLQLNAQDVRTMLTIPNPNAYWAVLERHGLR